MRTVRSLAGLLVSLYFQVSIAAYGFVRAQEPDMAGVARPLLVVAACVCAAAALNSLLLLPIRWRERDAPRPTEPKPETPTIHPVAGMVFWGSIAVFAGWCVVRVDNPSDRFFPAAAALLTLWCAANAAVNVRRMHGWRKEGVDTANFPGSVVLCAVLVLFFSPYLWALRETLVAFASDVRSWTPLISAK